MKFTEFDATMMRRALRLAKNGEGRVSPNPMVGAVITHEGRIIGSGWHRRWGGPHAEVNAIASVRDNDLPLLQESTMYVTLEPCSHYGKTPPCAKLLIDKGIKKVVVAMTDPFKEVSGRGIRMLKEAGIEVETGLMEDEAMELNRRFITAHTLKRPFVQLKWAETTDGFIAGKSGDERLILSNPVSMVWMHRERSKADAIMVGTNTVIADNPQLDCRHWPGRTPVAVSFNSQRLPDEANILDGRKIVLRQRGENLRDFLNRLYSDEKIISLMVEGGAQTLGEFLRENIADEIRVETNPLIIKDGIRSPDIKSDYFKKEIFTCGENFITTYRH